MALGHVIRAHNVVHFNLPLREGATEAHTVSGLKHNLLSMYKLAVAGYTAQFVQDKVRLFEAHGDHRVTPHQAVLEGCYIPEKGS